MKHKTTKPHDTNLGELLRLRRAVRGDGIRDLAREIGISSATLFRIEQGHRMDLDTFQKLLVWFQQPSRGYNET